MNKNMRKMYTEEEIVALAQKHISGGTQLYKIVFASGSTTVLTVFTNNNSLSYTHRGSNYGFSPSDDVISVIDYNGNQMFLTGTMGLAIPNKLENGALVPQYQQELTISTVTPL